MYDLVTCRMCLGKSVATFGYELLCEDCNEEQANNYEKYLDNQYALEEDSYWEYEE